MFCDNCGSSLKPGQNFCSRCGRQLVAKVHSPPPEPAPPRSVPPPFTESRVIKHVKILAILWLVVSVFRLAPALGLFFGGGFAMHFIPFPIRAFLLPLAGVFATFLLASAVAGLLAGWGLLNYRPWARVLALILGAISLLHFPFGTALGIYTLWVLLPAESENEYRRLAGASY
jgi:hypothetical protein